VTRSDDSLTSPYRAVRPIAVPGDGPWPGMLTCLPSGELRVLVDADLLGPEWRGWDAASDGHVLAALDVVRRQDGHDVVLPVCPESLDAFLARRAASAAPLRAAEAVTIGVSLLRGCAEIVDRAGTAGAWWLTDVGRPVFATDAAGPPILEGTRMLLDDLARAAPHPTAWAEADDALSAVRISAAELDRAELGLFAVAAPAPLDLARTPAARPAEAAGRLGPAATIEAEPPRGLWESLARHVDADLADAVSRVTTSVWRRARAAPTGRRRAPLLAGAAVAAAVIGVGLTWPADPGDVATAGGNGPGGAVVDPSSTAAAAPTAGQTATPQPTSPPGTGAAPSEGAGSEGANGDAGADEDLAGEDLAGVAAALLAGLDECGEDAECRAAIVMDAGAVRPMSIPAERRAVALLDDFGGVAVLRVDDTSGGAPSQLIVIARRDGEWLLRDVHDATQQP
jgi:hypothetical protein